MHAQVSGSRTQFYLFTLPWSFWEYWRPTFSLGYRSDSGSSTNGVPTLTVWEPPYLSRVSGEQNGAELGSQASQCRVLTLFLCDTSCGWARSWSSFSQVCPVSPLSWFLWKRVLHPGKLGKTGYTPPVSENLDVHQPQRLWQVQLPKPKTCLTMVSVLTLDQQNPSFLNSFYIEQIQSAEHHKTLWRP